MTRSRYFATLVYPETAKENWFSILENHHIPCFIIFHDKDLNSDGSLKKPHFHVLIMFDSLKSEKQVKEIIKSISGVGLEKINSLRSYARYLCHLDNPNKTQYPIEQVISLCGSDYPSIISLEKDKYKILQEIINFINKENIFSYYELCSYSSTFNYEWFKIIASNTIFLNTYLKSRYWTLKENNIKSINSKE